MDEEQSKDELPAAASLDELLTAFGFSGDGGRLTNDIGGSSSSSLTVIVSGTSLELEGLGRIPEDALM